MKDTDGWDGPTEGWDDTEPLTPESEALLNDIPFPPLKHGSNELRDRLAAVEAAARAEPEADADRLADAIRLYHHPSGPAFRALAAHDERRAT